jgi:hypothetical protein
MILPAPRPDLIPPVGARRGWMRVGVMLGLLVWNSAHALPGAAPQIPARSFSGQFVVYTAKSGPRSLPMAALARNTNYVALDQNLLAISSERIKQKLTDELGISSAWRGKVYLNLRPARSADDTVTIISQRDNRGWNYRVDIPDVLHRGRFMCGLVDVLLIEIANRNAGSHSAEIPAWMAEGFARDLRSFDELELILATPSGTINGLNMSSQTVSARFTTPIEKAKQSLSGRSPLTFEQLSWPFEGGLDAEAAAVYGGSAQLFFDSLLRLPDGPACFRKMLDALPGCYNWQIAFFAGFQPHFQSALEVEKWWALQGVQISQRQDSLAWTEDQTWRKLDEIIRSPVGVRTSETNLPTYSEVSLQTIIREWDRVQQNAQLQRKLRELGLLRPRVAPGFEKLVDDYRGVIQWYLKKRADNGLLSMLRRQNGPASDRVTAQAVRQLDALDSRLAAMRPLPAPPPSSVTLTTSSPP